NLKVGYNRVFGYYLEVSTSTLGQELDYYRRQETGTDCGRAAGVTGIPAASDSCLGGAIRDRRAARARGEPGPIGRPHGRDRARGDGSAQRAHSPGGGPPPVHGRRHRRAGRARVAGPDRRRAPVRSPDDSPGAGDRDHRGSAPRRRAGSGMGRVHPVRHSDRRDGAGPIRRRRSAGRAVADGAEHGWQNDVRQDGVARHAHGTVRLLRSRRVCAPRARRSDLPALGRGRRHRGRAEHLHGRDDRDRRHSEERDAPQPDILRRGWAGDQYVRRDGDRSGHRRAARQSLPRLPHHLLNPLSRACRPRARGRRDPKRPHRGRGIPGPHRLHLPGRTGERRSELRRARRAARRDSGADHPARDGGAGAARARGWRDDTRELGGGPVRASHPARRRGSHRAGYRPPVADSSAHSARPAPGPRAELGRGLVSQSHQRIRGLSRPSHTRIDKEDQMATGDAALATPTEGTRSRAEFGSDYIVEVIRALGIEYAAFNPGSSFRGIHDSLVNFAGQQRPEIIECLHEEISVAIAHGYAKAAGRPMVAIAHNVVGLQHATMAIFNAWVDRVPILVVGGTVPVDPMRRRPRIDWIHTALVQGNLVRDFVKWYDQPPSLAACAESLTRAYKVATTQPTAPVYVCFDTELQEMRAEGDLMIPAMARYATATRLAPDPAALEQAADLLVSAQR